MSWDPDDGPQTAEDWAEYREQLSTTEMREWSCAEERAYARGVMDNLNAYFRRMYAGVFDELLYTDSPLLKMVPRVRMLLGREPETFEPTGSR